jgi:hypothetical protein
MKYRRTKYYTANPDNPDAKAICDRSGFVFNHDDLVPQMEWRGDTLEWTGLMVGPPFLDEPNEQLRNPPMFPDPVPVEMPKPPYRYEIVWSNQLIPWSQLTVVNWVSWSGSENGVPAAPLNERLQALEEMRPAPVEYPGGAIQTAKEDLTQAQILESLENFSWSNPNV